MVEMRGLQREGKGAKSMKCDILIRGVREGGEKDSGLWQMLDRGFQDLVNEMAGPPHLRIRGEVSSDRLLSSSVKGGASSWSGNLRELGFALGGG